MVTSIITEDGQGALDALRSLSNHENSRHTSPAASVEKPHHYTTHQLLSAARRSSGWWKKKRYKDGPSCIKPIRLGQATPVKHVRLLIVADAHQRARLIPGTRRCESKEDR